MRISGFQPLSLIDYPGIISSIVFTQGCPLRCVYCHNPELIPTTQTKTQPLPTQISEETVLSYLDKHARMIEGVCITGGEPTIHPDLPAFIRTLKKRRLLVKLDTNGLHPNMVKQLIDERLIDYLAMDLKHVWRRYREIIGPVPDIVIEQCQKTFSLIQDSSIPHEFRTTFYSKIHSEEDIQEIAQQLRPHERYALQDIRYGKTLQPNLERGKIIDTKQVVERLQIRYPTVEFISR